MTIGFPLYIFLFLYLLFLCIFIVFSLINAYHILSTGALTFASFTITVAVIILTLITLYFTWQQVSVIDWSKPFIIFDNSTS